MKPTNEQAQEFVLGFKEVYYAFYASMSEHMGVLYDSVKEFNFQALDVNKLRNEGKIQFFMRAEMLINELKRLQEAKELIE